MGEGSKTPVRITHDFECSPEVIFNFWVDPARMKRWLFLGPTSEIREVLNEPRAGGRFSIRERNQGETIDHFGVYEEVERPRLLEFTLHVPQHFSGVTKVRIELAPAANGCRMIFTQTGVAAEVTEGPWRMMFDTLARVCTAPA
jgi:uncharacterized protein YndB with AHSA1/START domain